MILVDTSAWIDFFRGIEPMASTVEKNLEENQSALCGPIITELFRGFKSKSERERILPLLDGCRFLAQPEHLWQDAGNLGFHLSRKGKTVKTLDLLIAAHAMAKDESQGCQRLAINV